MKKYEQPKIEVKEIELCDIITSSVSIGNYIIDRTGDMVTQTLDFDELNL